VSTALVQAIRDNARTHAAQSSRLMQIGTVTRRSPWQLRMHETDHLIEEEDIVITSLVYKYDIDNGIRVGDQVTVLHKGSQWIVTDVLSDREPSPAYAGSGSGFKLMSGDYGADRTGVIDSTASFNLAGSSNGIQIEPGVYKILGKVDWPPDLDVEGVGPNHVTLKLGPNGQIRIGDKATNTSAVGGRVGGFKIDGGGEQDDPEGALNVGFCLKKTFHDIWVYNTVGDAIYIATAQNCTWDTIQVAAGKSCVVLDLGAGGHVFYNPELNPGDGYSVDFRQSGQSYGGYPAFLGPSNNLFYGGIAEYGNAASGKAMVRHGAGTNNQFYGFSVCPTGRTVAAAAVRMEADANAVATTATITAGSASFTVADPTGIGGLMAARVPGFEAGSIVASVVGNVVTLFDDGTGASASYPAGTAVSFGAESAALCFDGLVTPGSAGVTYGIEMRGNTSITLSGRTTFTDHVAAIRCFSNDRVTIDGPVSQFDCPLLFQAHPSNDTGVTPKEDTCVRSSKRAGMDIVAAGDAAARGLTITRGDQSHPNLIAYPGFVLLSDGTFDPVSTGMAFEIDSTDGLHYLNALAQLKTSFVKVTGAAGATIEARYFGRYNTTGPPVGGAWRAGDWIIDANGTVWACKVAGTPGTWSAGVKPDYVAPTYNAGASNYAFADACGSAIDRDHQVVLRGAILTSTAFASGAALAVVAHPPASAVIIGTGVVYDGATFTVVPIAVESSGNVKACVALASGVALFLDTVTYHAA
jgi:hypothetical protein